MLSNAYPQIPGIATAIVTKDLRIQFDARGITNTEIPQAVTSTTIFEAASLSKPVFAFIVLKMIEEGKFSVSGTSSESGLNRPLYEICAFGPPLLSQHAYYKMLTVQRILSHQAGLPNWFEPEKPEEYLTEPGTRFDYSGVAFCFLKEVVEYLSGSTFEILAKQLFKQLEMNHSSFLAPDESTLQETNFAIGHDANNIPDKREHFPREFGANPAASLHTTAEDYAKFLRACVTDPFIKEHMFKSKIQLAGKDSDANVPRRILEKIDWGIGIGLQTLDGATIAFHWGDIKTSRSFAAINLRTNQAAVCFTNSANGPSVFQQIVEPVIGSINPVAEWLSHREGLPFQFSPTSTYTDILKSLGTPAGLLQEFDDETRTPPMIDHELIKNELPVDGLKRDLLKPDTVEHMPRAPENNIDVQDVVYDGKTFSEKSFFLNHDITAVTSTEESEILFKIASISKTMVAALVFKLQELGLLKISDPITNFLSYANDNLEGVGIFPELAGITIEDLLRHTSGLQDYTRNFDDKQARHDLPRDDVLRFTQQEKYSDKNHQYSNTNYLLIGKILDTLHRRLSDIDPSYSGHSVAEMMKKYVFEPAGMINSYMDTENGDFAKIPWNNVHAGLVTNQAGEVTCRSFQIPTFEAGGVVSTMADVTRFWYKLFHGKIIHSDSLTKMIEKKPDGKLEENSYYAAGIVISPTSFVDEVYSHSGGLPAQSSVAGYSKDQDGGKAFARITSSLMSLSADTAKEEVITPNASTRNLVLHEGADSVGSRLEELESKIPRQAYSI